ncbi:MAG: T9SS type A sorting domain-containing protein [Candidatus Kapabacteria bacterium]|nr:T9SS type A sorting domain-containing protein [Candidatus Kapabacteria bacterium]
MKSIGKYIIIIFFSISILIENTNAYDDCIFICEEITWQYSDQTHFTIISCSPSCTFVAYWSYRFVNCPDILPHIACEFKLGAIGCVGCPPSCWTCLNMFDLTHEAMKHVVKDQALQTLCATTLLPGECEANFSINYSSCWYNESASPSGLTLLLPCDESKCCKEIWKVCRDSTYPFKLLEPELVTRWGVNPHCDSTGCIAICESFPESPPSTKQNINYLDGFSVKVYPNPTDGFLNIQLQAEITGEHVVEIFDNNGNLLLSQSFTKSEHEKLIRLNLSKLPSGNYIFQIKHEGISKINGSFNLIR